MFRACRDRTRIRGIVVAVSLLALAVLPACAAEQEDGVATSDAELDQQWGEIDEDATPIGEAEILEALGDDDGDAEEADDEEPAGAAEATDMTVEAAADTIEVPVMVEAEAADAPMTAPPPLPASCNKATSLDLLVYTEGSSSPILNALANHAKPCSRYIVSLPKVGGSPAMPDAALWPRKVVGKGVRRYGNAFIASAEVHWGGARKTGRFYPGWKNVKVVKKGPARYETIAVPKSEVYDNDWYLKGVLFRQRMAKRGYRPQAGDTWHINELESGWARTRVQQRAIRQLVRGLADGDPEYDAATDPDPDIATLSAEEKAAITKAARMKDVRGVVFVSSLGKRRPGERSNAPFEDALKQTLRHRQFWAEMANDVSSFALERYLSFGGDCKTSLSAQSDAMAKDIMALELAAQQAPRYRGGARAGKSTVATALSYLSRAYNPVINAAWGFNNDARTLSQFSRFVRGQVEATRSYASEHTTPDNRIGIYFKAKDGATDATTATFADHVAASLNAAYDGHGGRPIAACGSAGAEGCTCGD
ncbi:MAG: hypothetical protein ACRELY_12780 [Polyangiaceae bacterium]